MSDFFSDFETGLTIQEKEQFMIEANNLANSFFGDVNTSQQVVSSTEVLNTHFNYAKITRVISRSIDNIFSVINLQLFQAETVEKFDEPDDETTVVRAEGRLDYFEIDEHTQKIITSHGFGVLLLSALGDVTVELGDSMDLEEDIHPDFVDLFPPDELTTSDFMLLNDAKRILDR